MSRIANTVRRLLYEEGGWGKVWTGLGMAIALAGGGLVYQQIIQDGGGFSGECLVSNRDEWSLAGTDCDFGTHIQEENANWVCNQPVANYGTLPIKVTLTYTAETAGNAVSLNNGCTGDGDSDTIDLILEVIAGGTTSGVGPTDDSAKLQPNGWPQDIEVTGRFDCGEPAPLAHPDGWQFQGGVNVKIVNGISGDWDAGTATCQGAGGTIFYSSNTQSNVDVLGGRYVSCNHGLIGGNSVAGQDNDVVDVGFRTGRVELTAQGGDPNCQGYFSTASCLQTSGLDNFSTSNNICEIWDPNTDTWIDDTGSDPH